MMMMKWRQLLTIVLLGSLLFANQVFASENKTSASVTIMLSVEIQPREYRNPRLSSVELLPGVDTNSCTSKMGENGLDPLLVATEDRVMAENFICGGKIYNYQLVENGDVITLLSTPV